MSTQPALGSCSTSVLLLLLCRKRNNSAGPYWYPGCKE
uniref:Uncharacterized protein n=1 Tax=Arundo donax TaxID=35708 RepID=A0A0A9B0U7_ARUDO